MTKIYMQLLTGKWNAKTKKVFTKELDPGEYITASDDELDAKLAEMARELVRPEHQVFCTYIGSLKTWNSKGEPIKN